MNRRALAPASPAVDDTASSLEVPVLAPRGHLTYHGQSVFLSEQNALVVSVFMYHFGSELTDLALLHRVWPEGATRWTLRLCLRRLNRRLARVGLTIIEVGEHAHMLRDLEAVERDRLASDAFSGLAHATTSP